MSFALDPRLAAETSVIGDLPLSRALLMNDARYLWVILTPRRAGAIEITDLDASERAELIEEIAQVAAALRAWPQVEKINFAALGNLVPQLHAHIVGRRRGDPAWPRPVWGVGVAVAYQAAEQERRLTWLAEKLGLARSASIA